MCPDFGQTSPSLISCRVFTRGNRGGRVYELLRVNQIHGYASLRFTTGSYSERVQFTLLATRRTEHPKVLRALGTRDDVSLVG